MKQLLIFVYNTDSGLFNSIADFAHKIILPKTYQCSLCALTYGNFTMKQEWESFIQQLPAETVFLHKDEFFKKHKLQTKLPAVFIRGTDKPELLVTDTEINNCKTLQQFEDLIISKLALRG